MFLLFILTNSVMYFLNYTFSLFSIGVPFMGYFFPIYIIYYIYILVSYDTMTLRMTLLFSKCHIRFSLGCLIFSLFMTL